MLSDKEKERRANLRATARPRAVSRAKIERQERVIALTAQGIPRVEIEAMVGIRSKTIDHWMRNEPMFRARYRGARDKAKGEYVAQDAPFDARFRSTFFNHPTPPHMQRIIDVLNEQTEIAEREGRRDRRVLILLPPEHGKTSLIQEYLVYRIAMDPTFRASMICSTLNQARKRIGAISRMLTDRSEYANLIDTYGPFKSEVRADQKPWTADHITNMHAPAAQVDFTLQAMGWTGSIYGDRMDIIVYDDIATLKNQTPAQIEAQWEKTWGENRSRIRKGGLFIVIGTHMKEGDIYTRMQDKGFFSEVIVMPAIVREPGTLSDDDPGEALWEDNVSLAELLKLREDDTRMFELMYQQNPLPSVGAVFPHEAIEACFDPERFIGNIPDGSIIVAGIDPSVSNYTAGVVMALKKHESGEWMRYLVDVWNEKNLTGEGGDNYMGVVEFIVELCKTYRVQTLCVEDGTWMSLINNALTLRSQLYELGVNHVPIQVSDQTVGAEAIRQLSGLFTHRLINLPGSPQSRHHLSQFTTQLLTWTGERSHWRKSFDIVKAFRQAEHAVRIVTRSGKAHIPSSMGNESVSFLEEIHVA